MTLEERCSLIIGRQIMTIEQLNIEKETMKADMDKMAAELAELKTKGETNGEA